MLKRAKRDGNKIEFVNEVKHLGNIVSNDSLDSNDCNYKRGIFTGSVNKLIGNFFSLSTHRRAKLFHSYCCCFYGS